MGRTQVLLVTYFSQFRVKCQCGQYGSNEGNLAFDMLVTLVAYLFSEKRLNLFSFSPSSQYCKSFGIVFGFVVAEVTVLQMFTSCTQLCILRHLHCKYSLCSEAGLERPELLMVTSQGVVKGKWRIAGTLLHGSLPRNFGRCICFPR